jgi:phytanoyl-CoA hydroxylase
VTRPLPHDSRPRLLTGNQTAFFEEHGYLHVPGVFSPDELGAMERDLRMLIDTWALATAGWTGPWRQVYMDETTERDAQLIALHDLELYSQAWCAAVVNPRLCGTMADLLGPNVEFHHSTLHVKPPETGQPFPLHQDWPFYEHEDGRYVDVLVHLDDTDDTNGCIRFLDGSHTRGALEHITSTPDGPCDPHLPTDVFRLDDTVPVPAQRGDIVCFHIYTIHGSRMNQTRSMRRLVRLGYRDPNNIQVAGDWLGRPGMMVRGVRPRRAGAAFAPVS